MERMAMGINQLAAQWEKGKFHRVYLFAGTDLLQKEEAVGRLTSLFLGGDESGLNVDRFDGETATGGEILSAARTLPFLGGRRLVLVRRANQMAASETGPLADGLSALPSGNCLVFLWDERSDARNVLVQAVQSRGAVVTFWVPFPDQLPGWIQERARVHGKSITGEGARALLESVGPNTQDLAQELEKLALYTKGRPSIDVPDVKAFQNEDRTLQFMEWDRALWKRDTAKALGLLTLLRSQAQGPEVLLGQLTRAYRRLLLGKTLLAEKQLPLTEIGNQLWIKSRDLQQEFTEAARSFGWEELLDSLAGLLEAERDLKTGRMDPETGLSLLVVRLTGGRKEKAISKT